MVTISLDEAEVDPSEIRNRASININCTIRVFPVRKISWSWLNLDAHFA